MIRDDEFNATRDDFVSKLRSAPTVKARRSFAPLILIAVAVVPFIVSWSITYSGALLGDTEVGLVAVAAALVCTVVSVIIAEASSYCGSDVAKKRWPLYSWLALLAGVTMVCMLFTVPFALISSRLHDATTLNKARNTALGVSWSRRTC